MRAMVKKILLFLLVNLMLPNASFAQGVFGFAQTPPTTTNAPAAPVLTPDQFNQAVAEAQAAQKAEQQNKPIVPEASPPATQPPEATGTTPSPTPPLIAAPNSQTQKVEGAQPTPPPGQPITGELAPPANTSKLPPGTTIVTPPVATGQSTVQGPTAPPPLSPAPPLSSTPQSTQQNTPPKQTQVYTGFGNSSGNPNPGTYAPSMKPQPLYPGSNGSGSGTSTNSNQPSFKIPY